MAAVLRRARMVAPGAPIRLVTTAQTTESPEWAVHLADYRGEVRMLPAWDAAAARQLAREAVAADARLVIPDADRVLPWLAHPLNWRNLRQLRASLLLMRPYCSGGTRGRVVHIVKLLLVATVGRVGPGVTMMALASDQSTVQPHRASRHRLAQPLTWIPDLLSFRPASHDRDTWYRAHQLDPAQVTYLVIGDLGERKSVPQILRAWSRIRPEGARLLLVGVPEDAVRRGVARLPADIADTVVLIEGYVPDENFDAWVAHADAVLLVHRNEGASGVFAKAMAAGTPALVGGAVSLVRTALAVGLPAHVVEASDAGLDAVLCDRTLPARLRTGAVRRGRIPAAMNGSAFADALLGLGGRR